jgi:tetratricopeptide (TPR) repeat protein
VESLLSHDEHSEGFMAGPALAGALESLLSTKCVTDEASEPAPERIGRYVILNELGRGGMGVVYRAKQDKPDREVALKVIRPGIASDDMLRRFEYEAQLLGRLRHPGIAQIYEAGTADAGRGVQPYYAMEIVNGESLNDFLKLHELTVPQKLELMIRICDAVHHAHQKGIIHRDLKPANVLIESGSGANASHQPKILDFGVARAIGADDRRTVATNAGQIIGTISYMSPEQVSGDSGDLDTRSDVYALGVIAFEMLAGRRPHVFADKSLPECARIIRDEKPLRLGKVDRALGGDLDTIVAKALENDRDRRYQTAAELAADLRRFLNHEPIAARLPTVAYKVRKFVQRRPAVAVSVSAMTVVAIIATWMVMFSASAARVAEQRRLRADEMKVDLLGFIRQKEDSADPLRPIHVDPQKLFRISEFVSNDLQAESKRAIQLRNLLGENYILLGDYGEASAQIQDALSLIGWPGAGPSEDLGTSLQNMGRVLYHEGRYSDAAQMYAQALDVRGVVLGLDHPDVAMTISHMAACLRRQGDYGQAEALYRQALDIRKKLPGNSDAIIASSFNSLALFYMDGGRWNDAHEQFTTSLALVGKYAKPDDFRVARTQSHLAGCLIQLGKLNEAEAMLTTALDVQARNLPQDHPDIANTIRTQAELRLAQRNVGDAERLARAALAIQTRRLGEDHADLADSYLVLGETLLEADALVDAADAFERSLHIRSVNVPAGHWLITNTQRLLDECNAAIQEQEFLYPDPEPANLR